MLNTWADDYIIVCTVYAQKLQIDYLLEKI